MIINSPWKKDFPALANTSIYYLDSAATCQVPSSVIEAVTNYLTNGHGNPGRGLHKFGENADKVLNDCRQKVADFVGAKPDQIVFTKGATESINFVANSMRSTLTEKDSILVTEMEHHSNLLPWQRLSQQTGARLNILPLDNNGDFDLSDLEKYLDDSCQMFAFTHGSNVLGNHPPVDKFVRQAKKAKVPTLIDGAQAVAHTPLDLDTLSCDYYVFSGHKLYAPGGSGVLYIKNDDSIEPLLLGGGIVSKTTLTDYHLTDGVAKFEAGSSNLVALVGLSASLEYINDIGLENIVKYEQQLYRYLLKHFQELDDFDIVSHPDSKSVLSFHSKTIHCHDIASILSDNKIAVRAGHHCAQPCLNAVGVKHCVRASIGIYNDSEDIDRLIDALKKVTMILAN